MAKKPGDSIACQVIVRNPSTGALVAADSLPVAKMVHNGVDDGTVTLTVASVSTGVYLVTGTIPSSGYASGDDLQVRVNYAVSAVAMAAIKEYGTLDGLRCSDVPAAVWTNGGRTLTSFSFAVSAALTSAGLDGITIEAGLNARQALAIVAAALDGILTGAGTGTITIQGAGVSTPRIVAITDALGNRTSVTLTPPA